MPDLVLQVPFASGGRITVDLRPGANAWIGNRLLAWGIQDTTESTARAFDLNTFRWEDASSPKLATCDDFPGAIASVHAFSS